MKKSPKSPASRISSKIMLSYEEEFIQGINLKPDDDMFFHDKKLHGEKKEYLIPKLNTKLKGD